jgi:hypothetical protein
MTSLTLRRGPLRLLVSRGLWAGLWYLVCYQVTGWVLFSIALTAVLTAAVLGCTLLGIPLLIAVAAVVRGCADIERLRLRPLSGALRAGYCQEPSGPLLSRWAARWRDPALWRDLAYLVGLFPLLAALGLAALCVWAVLLAGVTLPVWYWAPWQSYHGVRYHGAALGYFPNGPHGSGSWGFFIGTLPQAFLTAAVFLVALLAFNYVVVATVRAHLAAARALLGRHEDPLRAAKEVLSSPGPLAAAEAAQHFGTLTPLRTS